MDRFPFHALNYQAHPNVIQSAKARLQDNALNIQPFHRTCIVAQMSPATFTLRILVFHRMLLRTYLRQGETEVDGGVGEARDVSDIKRERSELHVQN